MAEWEILRELRKPTSGKSCPLWVKSKGSLQNTSPMQRKDTCCSRRFSELGWSQGKYSPSFL